MEWMHEPFFIVEDNVMSDAELNIMLKEAKEINEKEARREDTDYYHYNRMNIISGHKSLPILQEIVFQRKWWEISLTSPDLAWHCNAPNYQAAFTAYSDGDHYRWHADHNVEKWSRPLSFIIYLTDKKFTGGETCLSMTCGSSLPDDNEEPWKVIKPKAKRMLMFPSYIYHKVNKVKLENDLPFEERRLTINGHLRFKVD